MYPDLIVTAQSAALRVWAGTLSGDELAGDSALPGWTVAELLAHLVAVHDAVAGLRPTQDAEGVEPLSVADYVLGYAGDADRTARMARSIARETAGDPLAAWDSAAAEARQTLGALGAADRLVITRRGPMLASAFLTTRVIELVVHADDLHRSVPERPAPPVLPAARQHALTALREVLTTRDPDPQVLAAASALDEQAFVELATGRRAPDGELPEPLTRALPLL